LFFIWAIVTEVTMDAEVKERHLEAESDHDHQQQLGLIIRERQASQTERKRWITYNTQQKPLPQ
jgi:hypothetical protein